MSTLITSSLITISSIEIQGSQIQPTLSWSPEQMIRTKLISDIQLSPDNEHVLFVATEAKLDAIEGVALSRIYRARSDNSIDVIPFSTAEHSATQPRWAPNGKWIAFLSNRDGAKNLYLVSSDGGEAIPLTKNKKDIQTFSWSPDSKKIAFVMADETENEKERIKTSLAYVYQQKSSVNRLWLIDISTPDRLAKPLTSDDYCVRGCGDFGTINVEFDWSPDGNTIVFAHSPSAGLDDFHLDSSLATINLATGIITPWEKHECYEALPRYSPDGLTIAYVSSNSLQRYAINRGIALRSVEGNSLRFLVKTFNEGAFLSGPNFLGWSKEGDNLLFYEPKGTKFHIALIPADGSPSKQLETGDYFFKDPVLSFDKTMIGFIGQTPTHPPEACITKLNSFKPIQISSLNQHFCSYPQLKTEVISWRSSDGLKIEGLVTYPPNYQPEKQYPLLLVIHGGPMGFFDETFLGTPNPYPLASFAEMGFIVLRPNPRGSTGYGKEFRCANYEDWGGMDFIDIMSGVDSLIAQGKIDPERLGVMGWSYGGYMTAWIISQTSRFKAASWGAGPYHLVSMAGTTDLHRFFTDYLGDFIDQKELYNERSPIHHVVNIKTPCLIQHGVEDKRVPVSQAYELYYALENAGKKPTLILYPKMEHRISDPKMQLDAMECNLAWFKQHLIKTSQESRAGNRESE